MAKILIATVKPFAPAAVVGIRKAVEEKGDELVVLEKYAAQSDLIAAVADVDAMIVRSDKITAEVLEAAKNLKIVVRAGAGYDNVDLEAATAHGVCVMNTPGQNANAVAELALGLLVYAMRNFYNGKAGGELKGKKLGILAFGNVGRDVAHIAKGFGLDIYAYDAFCSAESIEAAGVKAVASTAELFEKCQIISLHIPATPETKGSINLELMKSMPANAILLNTARKEVICEDSLKQIFVERPDFKYIADIAPDCASELEKTFPDRYFGTPKKMGAQTAEANINAGIAAANQIEGFLKKGIDKFRVNK